MPSVRLELTTFRLWDWRANQLRQEGWAQSVLQLDKDQFNFKESFWFQLRKNRGNKC